MSTFTITVPDEQSDRVVDALCRAAGLPESSVEGAQQALAEHVERTVNNVEQGKLVTEHRAAMEEAAARRIGIS